MKGRLVPERRARTPEVIRFPPIGEIVHDLHARAPVARPRRSFWGIVHVRGDPAAFRAFLDKLLEMPMPELDSLHAAEALGELRIHGKA
jgi:hypothetical protein